VLKKLVIVLLAIVLLISPLVVRWLYFYEGRYEPGQVPRPDLSKIEEPLPQTQPFTDQEVAEAQGTVLLDQAHKNRVTMAELNVLQARLTARGQQLEPVVDAANLNKQLRNARALVIISPGEDWKPEEIQSVERFVEKGGRLLLVADPTRYDVILDEFGDFVGFDNDSPHLNDLAARFDLVFQEDYLYNTVDNEGNFRNIKLTDLADGPLTQGVDQLVFFATHSIVSEEPALIRVGGETRSSSSGRAEELTVGMLSAGGSVLALGDLTFMTEPYDAVYDNDQFVANIAGFLSGAQRQYELADFPFFFDDAADLVYAGDPVLNSSLLKGGSTLQALFDAEGKALAVRAAEDKAQDTLFFGLYEQAEEVEPYLTAAGVTLVITPTQTSGGGEATSLPTATPKATPVPSSSQSLTGTLPITPTQPPGTAKPSPETKAEAESPASGTNRIVIEPLGEMALAGTSLLLMQTDEQQRVVMVVLANTDKGLENALERLSKGDLADCLLQEAETGTAGSMALCPTGETVKEEGTGWQEPAAPKASPTPSPTASPATKPEQPAGQAKGKILILSLDEGKGRYDSLTGADDFASVLEESFEVTVRSVAKEGLPDVDTLLKYDLTIWTAGDYEEGVSPEASDLMFELLMDGEPIILSGAYASDSKTEAVQRDLQVKDATHPLAKGFQAGQVIGFVAAPSGKEYEIIVPDDFKEDQSSVIFVRGPESEESGADSIAALEDQVTGFRLVFIGFPVYLLPDTAKSQLVLNSVSWLLSPQG
jgi:hypothetical protein